MVGDVNLDVKFVISEFPSCAMALNTDVTLLDLFSFPQMAIYYWLRTSYNGHGGSRPQSKPQSLILSRLSVDSLWHI
jgi:hypothetical protein